MKNIATLLVSGCLATQAYAATSKRPNIVLLLADDMGYGNLGCYGTKDILTPNIDRLAAEGLKFTDAHAPAAVCQPTRYGILSGRYYWRCSYPRIQSGIYFRDNEMLLPKLLQQSGYATAMFGKWHLGFGLTQRGEETDWNGELKPGPVECGFDYWFGMPNSHAQPPYVFVENHRIYKGDSADPIKILSPEEANARGIKPPAGAPNGWGVSVGARAAHEACDMYRLDLIMAERASAFIRAQSSEKPFFLYVPFFAPHVPLAVAPEFRDKSPMFARLKKQNNAVRTAEYCQQLDHAVGAIMATLKECNLDENTLVVFSSDNGNLNFGDNVAVHFRTNGPFLGQKTDTWEGGHQIPCIACWPGRIAAGKTTDKLFSLADLYRTFLAAAEVPTPAGAAPDSLNLLSLLENPDTSSGRVIMTYKGKAAALRIGDWAYYPEQGAGGLWTKGPCAELDFFNSDYDDHGELKPDAAPGQLYNLRKDPSQTTNLYRKEPELVQAMGEILRQAFADAKRDVPLETYLPLLKPEMAMKLNLVRPGAATSSK